MKKKTLIPVFPGTNCEKESLLWISCNLETEAEFLDLEKHSSLTASEIDAIFIPGGFSYGDYLRAGAIASRSKEMSFIKGKSKEGIPILGICNGFQILCESGLLPGALVKNITRQHHHFPVSIKIDPNFLDEKNTQNKCAWLPQFSGKNLEKVKEVFASEFLIPMSCGMGNWLPPLHEVEKVTAEKNAVIYYNHNENGSYKSIAGIIDATGNIFGMMPHPERASDLFIGSTEGLIFLLGISQSRKIKIKAGSPLEQFSENLNRGVNKDV
jgi:phosphoribosylformylglycinamidine synthase subunit PurQ / glutaminase